MSLLRRRRRAVWMMRPHRDGDLDLSICDAFGDRWTPQTGWTWELVPAADVVARTEEGWKHRGLPDPRPPVDRRGFPLPVDPNV